jgi:hypothetical protein
MRSKVTTSLCVMSTLTLVGHHNSSCNGKLIECKQTQDWRIKDNDRKVRKFSRTAHPKGVPRCLRWDAALDNLPNLLSRSLHLLIGNQMLYFFWMKVMPSRDAIEIFPSRERAPKSLSRYLISHVNLMHNNLARSGYMMDLLSGS